MTPERQRIEEDLRGVLSGEVRCDQLFSQLYANDGSIFEVLPIGVVRPQTTEDIQATIQYASENGLSIHPRGAGSGLAGESLGKGLILDLSRYFRQIGESFEQSVQVQTGVVLDNLNLFLKKNKRHFGPNPATGAVTTLGGMVAVDASGSYWPRYGSTRDQVRRVTVVLADGSLHDFSKHPLKAEEAPGEESPRLRQLINSVTRLLKRHHDLIVSSRPKSLVNQAGYILHDLLEEETLDLAKLMVGTEGTLGVMTEFELTTARLPAYRGCVLLLFDSLDKAAQAVLELQVLNPAACDLMDRRHINLAREMNIQYELQIPAEAEAVLLVEQFAETQEELQAALELIVTLAQHESRLAAGALVAKDQAEYELYWNLARHFVPTLYRLKGSERPIPFIEDITVPPASLPTFFRHIQDTLKQHQVTASLFGHAGHGQLNIRPFLDLSNPEDVRKIEPLAYDLYDKVWQLGGTISGSHGDGMSRTPFLSRQYGPLVNVFQELKSIFDPRGVLNPGKIINEHGRRITDDLRPVSFLASTEKEVLNTTLSEAEPEDLGSRKKTATPQEVIPLQLYWEGDEITHTAQACNGCAGCRTESDFSSMCPIFRIMPTEEASPRAKANLMRAVMTGNLPSETLLSEEARDLTDLCIYCHMCRLECPAEVDIPKLMLEAKATYVHTNGQKSVDWILTRIDKLAAWASLSPMFFNWALSNRQMRWVMKKTMGLAPGRNLPKLAKRSFLKQAVRLRLNQPLNEHLEEESGPTEETHNVLYFVDTYANYFDTELASALIKVLEHNRITAYVPSEQLQAGMPFISHGALEPARKIAIRNVTFLAEAIRQGYKVLATEPSAVLALTHEYPTLLDNDEDALLVAQHTTEACHYLWKLYQRTKLKTDFKTCKITAGYHVPCHLRALENGTPAEHLLGLIPGLQVKLLESGCSGMAGLYGLKQENFHHSIRAGQGLISAIRSEEIQVGITECSTCKIQMEHGTHKPTFHPIKVLAQAYGLMQIEDFPQTQETTF